MHVTTIEWVFNPDGSRPGWVSNPITGCLGPEGKGPCPYCYAKTLANGRLKPRYLANKQIILPFTDQQKLEARVGHDFSTEPFFPRWWSAELEKVAARKKPAGIFLCDMSDWLGDWVPFTWQKEIIDYIKHCNWHRFYVLTKHPLNLLKFSPWPDNCYVGTTVDTPDRWKESLVGIAGIKAKVKFISFEPLLGRMPLDMAYKFDNKDVQQVIIGACTGAKKSLLHLLNNDLRLRQEKLEMVRLKGNKYSLQPKREWVDEIIIAAKDAGVKVFLKNNLLPLMGPKMMEMKEMP